MIRLLYFNYSSELGGAEYSLLSLLGNIDRKKYTPILLTCGSGALENAATAIGVRVIKAKPRMSFGIWKRESILKLIITRPHSLIEVINQLIELRQVIRKEGVDILHCNNPKSWILGTLATTCLNVQRVWHIRDVFNKKSFSYFLVLSIIFLYQPKLIAISGFVFLSLNAVARRKCRVIANGIEFLPSIVGRKNTRKSLGISESTSVLLVAGRLVKWKGHEEVVREIAPYLKRSNYCLVFVGTNSYGGADYIQHLKTLCVEMGIKDKVLFLGFRRDMGDIYAVADVLVMASINEPFGRVVAEAQLSGLPCVAYNTGGIREIIDNNETGLLAEEGNIRELCRMAVSLLENPLLSRNLAIRAQKKAILNWSPPLSARKVELFYENK